RRIAIPKAWDCADHRFLGHDYSRDLQPVEWGPTVIQQSSEPNVRFGSITDIEASWGNVRFTPKSGHRLSLSGCLLCAKSGHPDPLRFCCLIGRLSSGKERHSWLQ